MICLHFLKSRVQIFYEEIIGVNILSRDDPWDFKVELSTNEIFNIEITSIADNSYLFKKYTREETFIHDRFNEYIPLYELIKLNKAFPQDATTNLIKSYLLKNTPKKELVKNPIYNCQHRFKIATFPRN